MGLTFCQTVTLKPTNASYPGLDRQPESPVRLDSTPLPSLTGEVYNTHQKRVCYVLPAGFEPATPTFVASYSIHTELGERGE